MRKRAKDRGIESKNAAKMEEGMGVQKGQAQMLMHLLLRLILQVVMTLS